MAGDSATSGKLKAKAKQAGDSSTKELHERQITKKSTVAYKDFSYAHATTSGEKKDLRGEMPSEFNPALIESDWYAWWEKQGFFHADAASSKPPYVIPLPPPNVTGTLHIGHALVASLEDMLARVHRMRGFEVLWQPGSDHAGIATQVAVEKKVARDLGKTRHELGRDAFLEHVWEWVGEKSGVIFKQLREMGASLDWERSRFTMDEHMSKAVTEAFVRLFSEGKIYRENRLVNWDCHLSTAVSDIEVDFVEFPKPGTYRVPLPRSRPDSIPGGMPVTKEGEPVTHRAYEFGWMTHFLYPIDPKEGETQEEAGFIEIATTRLETMLTDQAVFIHPADESKARYRGRFVRHPFTNALIPILEDAELVKLGFGTGAVKITPGHDPHDFEAGRRHKLAFTSMLDDDGCIAAGLPYGGMFRYEARLAMERDLEARGLFAGKKPHAMNIGVCQRSGDIIEPRCKPQWYLNSREATARALEAAIPSDPEATPELEITPAVKLSTWRDFLGDYRDWCISRQLWWGHRIPAYLFWRTGEQAPAGDASEHYVCAHTEAEARTVAAERLGVSEAEVELSQDPDVLDTWFSSGLFPFSTVGWPDNDLTDEHFEKFFPASVLETGGDILFFWVARMVIMSYLLTDKLCFKRVLLHSMVRDAHGKKMSKSLGNVIDPLHVIHGVTLERLHAGLDADSNIPPKERARAKKCQAADFPQGIPMCGTDALRFALCAYTGGATARDINLDINRVISFRALCNKLWNACRYALLFAELRRPELLTEDDLAAAALPPFAPVAEAEVRGSTMAERWILSRLHTLAGTVNAAIDRFDVQAACSALQAWFMNDFCDWALEVAKPAIVAAKEDYATHKASGAALNATVQAAAASARNVLLTCIDNVLRLFHPFMPFVTEELWQHLPHAYTAAHPADPTAADGTVTTIMYAPFPSAESTAQWLDEDAETLYTAVQSIVVAARQARAKYNIPNSQKSEVFLVYNAESVEAGMAAHFPEAGVEQAGVALRALAAAGTVNVITEGQRKPGSFMVPLSGALAGHVSVAISLEGVDFAEELKSLRKREANLLKYTATMTKKLDPAGRFMQSAPAPVVEKEKAKQTTAEAELGSVQQLIAELSAL